MRVAQRHRARRRAEQAATPAGAAPAGATPAGAAAASPPDPLAPAQLAAALAPFNASAAAAQAALAARRPAAPLPRLAPGAPVAVCVHSGGNIFMQEIASLIAAGFDAAGHPAHLHDERLALQPQAFLPAFAARLVIAPHEFFVLPRGDQRVATAWAHGAILVNVEQLHTDWFQAGLPALRQAAAIFDINLQAAAALAQAGLPARFLPLGYVPHFPLFSPPATLPDLPALATLPGAIKAPAPPPAAPFAARPIDLLFIGAPSPRRLEILSRLAPRLARWRCHFVLPHIGGPQVADRNAVLTTGATLGLAQRAKLVLNLNQSDQPFFVWHRIVLQSIWQRALVVSEPLPPQTHILPGQHVLEAPLDELADLIDWLLGTQPGHAAADQVRHQAYRHLTENLRLDHILRDHFA